MAQVNNDICTKNGQSKTFTEDLEEHEELQYIKLIKRIIEKGNLKTDRTGTGTRSIFGSQMRFNLRDGMVKICTFNLR